MLDQVLWYNSISNTKGWLFFSAMYEAGINSVGDIYSIEHRRFLNCQEIFDKYKVRVDFMQMYRLIQSIPHVWKSYLRNPVQNYDPFVKENWYDSCLKGDRISRRVYWYMIEQSFMPPQGSMLLWSQDLDTQFSSKQWSKICTFPWKITLSTKLRLFQYQITQRCLITNINLFYYKIKDSKNCTFCNNSPETIKHMLLDCRIVSRFWGEVFDIFKYYFDDNRLNFSTSELASKLLLNRVSLDPQDYLNTLILIGKRYIYVARCQNSNLSIHAYVNQIIRYKELEMYIAIKNNTLDTYRKKWAKFNIVQ